MAHGTPGRSQMKRPMGWRDDPRATQVIEIIRGQIRTKKAQLKAMLDGCVSRDMTAEESTKFDKLTTDVEALQARLARLEKIGVNDDEIDEEDEPGPAGRSRRFDRVDAPSIRRSAGPGDAPAVHSERRPYSYHRALTLAAEKRDLDGVEAEISREIHIRTGVAPKGFYMPTGQDPELRDLAMGWKPGTASRMAAERRDLTTTTGTGSIFTIPDLPLIELLRSKLVIRKLGARVLSDMKGLFAIPRQTGKATVYWVGEENAATPSNPSLDMVSFSPKVAIAATNMSRLFIAQTSLDAEAFTKEDLVESMAREFDRVAIAGTGGTQPTGITQNSTILTNSVGLAIGNNGGVPSFGTVVSMESQVAGFNADDGKLAYLTTPGIRGRLKQTPKIDAAPGFPEFIWKTTDAPGIGEMNGYPAYVTTNVPGNLTKGASGGTLSAMIFADWSQLVCALWEGVDTIVNPYTNQLAGAIMVSTSMLMDVKVRHEESFAVVTDAQP